MSFKNYQQLQQDVVAWSKKLPRDYDLIVGIPRSGMLPALYLSLHLNVALSSLDIFAEDRQILASGTRYSDRLDVDAGTVSQDLRPRKVLIVDDCLASGKSIRQARALLANHEDLVIDYAAVYCEAGREHLLDQYFEVLEFCALFEWNMMHSWYLMAHACVDIDGVLCQDPTAAQDDDGPRYLDFLANARPLHLPSVKIHALVSCRLEKYREPTMHWLREHGVTYDHLILMDHPSKSARQLAGNHAHYKADVLEKCGAALFIESSLREAEAIFQISGKPVYCLANQMLYQDSAKEKGLYAFYRGHLTTAER